MRWIKKLITRIRLERELQYWAHVYSTTKEEHANANAIETAIELNRLLEHKRYREEDINE